LATGIEGPAANAAFNQVKGIVDALLGPKISNIHQWSKEKDLENQLSIEKLNIVFGKYLRRALAESNSIHSIVFPQQSLPLNEMYEPLSINAQDSGRQFSVDDLLTCPRAAIVDHAGMGKTTFSKFLFNQVVSNTDKIPILCSLRNIIPNASLLDFVRGHLDEFDQQFNPDVFIKLLFRGKFFIILDGFDEVNSSHQGQLQLQIEDFAGRCRNSSLFLTTRPQVNFPTFIGGITLKVDALSSDQVSSLIQRYDRVAQTDVGERLIKNFHFVPRELTRSPLLIGLIYRTFAVTNTISERITGFYGDTYEALYRGHDLTKAGFVRQKLSGLDIDDFRRALQALSFYCIASSTLSWKRETELVNSIKNAFLLISLRIPARDLAIDLISAVPFLIWEGNELKFVHKTFAEYFAAEFIVRSPDSERTLRQIWQNDLSGKFAQVFEYIAELAPSLSRRVFAVPLAKQLIAGNIRGQLSFEAMCDESLSYVVVPVAGREWRSSDFKPHLPDARQVHFIRLNKIDIACGKKGLWARLPNAMFQMITEELEIPYRSYAKSEAEIMSMLGELPEQGKKLEGELLARLLNVDHFRDIAMDLAFRFMRSTERENLLRTATERAAKTIINDEYYEERCSIEVASLIEAASRAI
jgi:hypothetical protein